MQKKQSEEQRMKLRYMIIGAGGVGGPVGA